MKILIAGAGRVGYELASVLSCEGHDITVIDRDSDVLASVTDGLDVICVEGGATIPETLESAGAGDADVVIAVTQQDEVNMVCGAVCSKLGAGHVIARVRDAEYINSTEFMRNSLGISLLFNPEQESAAEISRILRFPGATRVDGFSKGSVEIVKNTVPAGGSLDGVSLKNLKKVSEAKVLISVVERGEDALIPHGDFELKAGDILSITGAPAEMRRFFGDTGAYRKPVRNVMILGGGRTSAYLAGMLGDCGIAVTIIESDDNRCEELAELLPKARIICGDGTSADVLMEEGASRCDAFVAMTGDDGTNIISSMYVKTINDCKIVTRINRDYYSGLLEKFGLETIIEGAGIISQHIIRYVRAIDASKDGSMEAMYRLAGGRIEALEFVVGADARCIGVPLRELAIDKSVLITDIIRNREIINPDGDTVIEAGDHIILVAEAGKISRVDDIVRKH